MNESSKKAIAFLLAVAFFNIYALKYLEASNLFVQYMKPVGRIKDGSNNVHEIDKPSHTELNHHNPNEAYYELVKRMHFAFAGFDSSGIEHLANAVRHTGEIQMTENLSDIKEAPIPIAYLSPKMIYSQSAFKEFVEMYPEADIVVTIQNPILSFRTMYNEYYKHVPSSDRKQPESLVGICMGIEKVKVPFCTQYFYFHHFLARLGLTKVSYEDRRSEEEVKLLDQQVDTSQDSKWKGRLFLVLNEQLVDSDKQRRHQVETDLKYFLHIHSNTLNISIPTQDDGILDICHISHVKFRHHLSHVASRLVQWLKQYLLRSDRVVVANVGHFLQLLEGWISDPCSRTMHQIKQNFTPPLFQVFQDTSIQSNATIVHSHNNTLVDRKDSNLVDFLIGGFAKCATSSLMKLTSFVPNVFMGNLTEHKPKEVHELQHGDIAGFRKRFKHRQKYFDGNETRLINGYKNPNVLYSQEHLESIVTYFPTMDLVVNVRHPITHFQSQYNYKFRWLNETEIVLPKPIDLIGNCGPACYHGCLKLTHPTKRENYQVCTENSNFHQALSRLHLTPLTSEDEHRLLGNHNLSIHSNWKGRLFLSEIGQIGDKNATRKAIWDREYEKFLGLEPNSFSSFHAHKSHHPTFIHICDDEHKPVRDVLLEKGKLAATWIQKYLMNADRVVITDKNHFFQLLEKWKVDPCEEK